jgi:hypothetical protein
VAVPAVAPGLGGPGPVLAALAARAVAPAGAADRSARPVGTP